MPYGAIAPLQAAYEGESAHPLPIGGLVNRAEQAAATAVTGREHIHQAAHFPGRAERAVRLRDYFALQLHFADVVAAKAALPLTEVVEEYTNFYRRFGFGIWPDAPCPGVVRLYGTLTDPDDARPAPGLDAHLLCALPPNACPLGGSSLAALGAIRLRRAGCAFISQP
jgi:hypothetical protein